MRASRFSLAVLMGTLLRISVVIAAISILSAHLTADAFATASAYTNPVTSQSATDVKAEFPSDRDIPVQHNFDEAQSHDTCNGSVAMPRNNGIWDASHWVDYREPGVATSDGALPFTPPRTR